MLEFIHNTLEAVNAVIAVGILYLGFRLWPAISFALQKRAVRLFIAASAFFALMEILAVLDFLIFTGASDTIETVKEIGETAFIMCVAAAMIYLYQSEMREVTALRESADTDALTKLYNHAYFRRVAGRRFTQSKKYNLPLALCMLDVDNFKIYNDQFGHEAGNYALRRVAQVLQDTTRSDDVAARYGGEEFVTLVIGDKAELLAERIRANIESQCAPGSDPAVRRPVTVSIGLARLNGHMDSLEELIATADREMYRAKQAGKNRVSVAGETA